MTESEAKTKWCPFARVGSETSGLGAMNRDVRKGVMPEALCIGSACMAWRLTRPSDERYGGGCGLAGQPQ
jgi:hypothetical protein